MSRWKLIGAAIAAWFLMSGQAPETQRVPRPGPAVENHAADSPDNRIAPMQHPPPSIIQKVINAFRAHPEPADSGEENTNNGNVAERTADATEEQVFPARVGMAIGALGTILIFLAWIETRRALNHAKESGAEQTEKMRLTIQEAARSATAMEGVAKSMAVNAEQVVRSVEITGNIADLQEMIGKIQTRAYISVLIGTALYQDPSNNFEGSVLIRNTGSTPARNLKWRVSAAILPVPIPDDFRYPLPEERSGLKILYPHQDGTMGATVDHRVEDTEVRAIKAGHGKSLYVWGALSYEDVFGDLHRCTFAQQLFWRQVGDIREDGRIPEDLRGIFSPRHNCAN